MAVYAFKRGSSSFLLENRGGEGGAGVCGWNFFYFCVLILFPACPCMFPMMFLNSQCVPQSTTHSSHITHLSNTYHSNFAASTLIILFSEMLKFSDFFFFF
jgi:hypothetical protein